MEVDHSLSSVHLASEAFNASGHSSDIFGHLMQLLYTKQHVHDSDKSAFEAVLDSSVYYVDHGHRVCHGLSRVIDCMEHDNPVPTGSQSQSVMTVGIRGVHIVRVYTSTKQKSGPALRTVEMYIVNFDVERHKITMIERVGPVADAVDVSLLVKK
jgi:hypothetical protein